MRRLLRLPLEKIVSGGQTGADRAALDWALAHDFPAGGWCPRGRRAEDGTIPDRYPLEETPSNDYAERTLWNVRDSDGTAIFTIGRTLTGGSLLTAEEAARLHKPWIHLHGGTRCPAERLRSFLEEHRIRVLNAAGSRGSREPGVVRLVWTVLEEVLFADFLPQTLPTPTQTGASGGKGDAIEIRGLWLESRIGVTEAERSRPQPLRLSLRLETGDVSRAARSDRLEETVDYDELARAIRSLAASGSRKLLERLAEEIAAAVLCRPGIEAVSIFLEKFPLPQAEGVGIWLRRDRLEIEELSPPLPLG